MMIKCLLCLLIIAPLVFGQVSAQTFADDHCTTAPPAEKLHRSLEAFARSAACKNVADSAPANVNADPSIRGIGGSEDVTRPNGFCSSCPIFTPFPKGLIFPLNLRKGN
jgi:hypothetical protein